MTKDELVYNLIKNIPRGRVLTYGLIAQALKISNPRQVGMILHKNPNPDNYPCHRVVRSDGKLASGYAFGGISVQMKKLISEGIEIKNNKVDLDKYLWNGITPTNQ